MTLLVEVDRSTCMGTGVCERMAPEVFAVKADHRSSVIGDPGDEARVVEVAESCPTFSIRVSRGSEQLV